MNAFCLHRVLSQSISIERHVWRSRSRPLGTSSEDKASPPQHRMTPATYYSWRGLRTPSKEFGAKVGRKDKEAYLGAGSRLVASLVSGECLGLPIRILTMERTADDTSSHLSQRPSTRPNDNNLSSLLYWCRGGRTPTWGYIPIIKKASYSKRNNNHTYHPSVPSDSHHPRKTRWNIILWSTTVCASWLQSLLRDESPQLLGVGWPIT